MTSSTVLKTSAAAQEQAQNRKKMNKWSHLIAALALAIMVFVIHILFRNDNNVNKLDTVRLYTMVREKGDVGLALTYLNTQNAGMNDACAKLTNLSLTDAATIACRATRQTARDNILTAMKCDKFSSQVCSYLQRMVNGLISANRSTPGLTWVQGKDLTSKVPGYDLTYRQALYNAVQEAPNILHNGFWAKQDNAFIVLRTTLFNLIAITTLANIIVHISDAMPGWSWKWRLAMRVGYFAISFLVSIIGVYTNSGSAVITIVYIFVPALISLIYFEIFLDDPDVRPWVHPYTFSIIFACTTLLSLTENDVLNSSIIIVELLKAQAASQLYMEVVWYWTGYIEKKRLKSELVEVYKTQQVQYALFMGIILVALLPFLLFIAPYDYTNADMFLRIAPLIFTGIAVVGTIFLQGLILDEDYGIDRDLTGENHRIGPMRENKSIDQIYRATKVTGGKLGVSLLLLIFVAFVEFEFVADYFRTLRAYMDTMPEKSIQYDLSKTYLWGSGLLTPSVYTL
jgi:hypothetical protein